MESPKSGSLPWNWKIAGLLAVIAAAILLAYSNGQASVKPMFTAATYATTSSSVKYAPSTTQSSSVISSTVTSKTTVTTYRPTQPRITTTSTTLSSYGCDRDDAGDDWIVKYHYSAGQQCSVYQKTCEIEEWIKDCTLEEYICCERENNKPGCYCESDHQKCKDEYVLATKKCENLDVTEEGQCSLWAIDKKKLGVWGDTTEKDCRNYGKDCVCVPYSDWYANCKYNGVDSLCDGTSLPEGVDECACSEDHTKIMTRTGSGPWGIHYDCTADNHVCVVSIQEIEGSTQQTCQCLDCEPGSQRSYCKDKRYILVEECTPDGTWDGRPQVDVDCSPEFCLEEGGAHCEMLI